MVDTTFPKLIKLRFKSYQHTVDDNESSNWLTNQNTGATNVAISLTTSFYCSQFNFVLLIIGKNKGLKSNKFNYNLKETEAIKPQLKKNSDVFPYIANFSFVSANLFLIYFP